MAPLGMEHAAKLMIPLMLGLDSSPRDQNPLDSAMSGGPMRSALTTSPTGSEPMNPNPAYLFVRNPNLYHVQMPSLPTPRMPTASGNAGAASSPVSASGLTSAAGSQQEDLLRQQSQGQPQEQPQEQTADAGSAASVAVATTDQDASGSANGAPSSASGGWFAAADFNPWLQGKRAVEDTNKWHNMNVENAKKVVGDVASMVNGQIDNAATMGRDSTTIISNQLQNRQQLQNQIEKFWAQQANHAALATQQLSNVGMNPTAAMWWAGPPFGW